jgi:hypothetical protein
MFRWKFIPNFIKSPLCTLSKTVLIWKKGGIFSSVGGRSKFIFSSMLISRIFLFYWQIVQIDEHKYKK